MPSSFILQSFADYAKRIFVTNAFSVFSKAVQNKNDELIPNANKKSSPKLTEEDF